MKKSAKYFLFVALSCVSLTSVAAKTPTVGFGLGNSFEDVPVSGFVQVSCNDGIHFATANWDCQGDVFNPATEDFFVITPDTAFATADNIILQAHHDDGTVTRKSAKFLGAQGRSRGRFNLWLRSVFQTPLLSYGTNTIDYQLRHGGHLLSHGTFVAKVTTGQGETCSDGFINSTNMADCQIPAGVCGRYFAETNGCH